VLQCICVGEVILTLILYSEEEDRCVECVDACYSVLVRVVACCSVLPRVAV